jgi:hypothetical protein
MGTRKIIMNLKKMGKRLRKNKKIFQEMKRRRNNNVVRLKCLS